MIEGNILEYLVPRGGLNLDHVHEVRDLGVIIDSKLTFSIRSDSILNKST